jgi:hypothetical protein
MAKKAKAAKKASKPKDRVAAAHSAWAVRRELYGENGISPEVMKEREKAKKAKAKAAKKRPAARKKR